MQNEAWAEFNQNVTSWVEEGATTGWIGGHNPYNQPGYVYFTAEQDGNGNYSETDWPNGPGGNNWWNLDVHYVPYSGGQWYLQQAGTFLIAYGGLPSHAVRLQVGLEQMNVNIVNWGRFANLAWWDADTGELHSTYGWGWPGVPSALPWVQQARGQGLANSPPGLYTCVDLTGLNPGYFVNNGNNC
jgi:hypothetical protein